MRLALNWIEGRVRSCWTGDPDDLELWLAADDEALGVRTNERSLATLAAAGGDIG